MRVLSIGFLFFRSAPGFQGSSALDFLSYSGLWMRVAGFWASEGRIVQEMVDDVELHGAVSAAQNVVLLIFCIVMLLVMMVGWCKILQID